MLRARRRDPKNPSKGLSDPEARVGRGKRGHYFLGYKVHYSLDWSSELPVAYVVRPANENEKLHFKFLALKTKERFPNAKWHIADSQYSSERLRRFVKVRLKGRPVIAKREKERRGKEDFYVDKLFRPHGNPMMCNLYKRRTACERMNSRAERLIGRNTLRGLKRVKAYVGIALTLMLLIAAASYRNGKPWLTRSIEYYASH